MTNDNLHLLAGQILHEAMWNRQDCFVSIGDSVYQLPEFDRHSGPVTDLMERHRVNRKVSEIGEDDEGGLIFLFNDGSVLTHSLVWNPWTETSDYCFDLQDSKEASEWRDEYLRYRRLC